MKIVGVSHNTDGLYLLRDDGTIWLYRLVMPKSSDANAMMGCILHPQYELVKADLPPFPDEETP